MTRGKAALVADALHAGFDLSAVREWTIESGPDTDDDRIALKRDQGVMGIGLMNQAMLASSCMQSPPWRKIVEARKVGGRYGHC